MMAMAERLYTDPTACVDFRVFGLYPGFGSQGNEAHCDHDKDEAAV